jgi:hypothetical protein
LKTCQNIITKTSETTKEERKKGIDEKESDADLFC